MTELIITDIDGTLIAEGNTQLNPEYYKVIRQLTDQGIVFAVATGRSAVSVRKTFAPVLDRIRIVALNGAVIEHQGEVCMPNPLPREWAVEFWRDLSSYPKVDSILNTAERTYCPYEGSQMYRWVKDGYGFDIHGTGGWDVLPEKETFAMVTIFHPDSAEEFCRNSIIPARWSDRLDLLVTGKTWVDCMMPGVSKGNAMLRICEDLGIDPVNAIAFGDNMNDISMIRMAGRGYAVDNARKEVQEAADEVIPGFREDGVLQILKRELKQR